MDDEALMRDLLRRILTSVALGVDEAAGGHEAVAPYRAVLLDVTLRYVSGLQFLAQLRHTKPEVPVLLMNCADVVGKAETLGRDRRCAFMAKPFGVAALGRKLAELLLPPAPI